MDVVSPFNVVRYVVEEVVDDDDEEEEEGVDS